MRQKYLKAVSFLMLVMTIGFSIASFMGHKDATIAAMSCAGGFLATYGANRYKERI